ncbi:hypothetical protein DWV00_04135 [Trinickia dinghuensis]|uniref:Uncharacterized protein n=1 Tax=Trinickia dinghuensis TaxID=2291023 RepID=A0A3D8K476_9BURK|nr:hypothetical protein DWV00_04135 [Trinickia dinghuensis]
MPEQAHRRTIREPGAGYAAPLRRGRPALALDIGFARALRRSILLIVDRRLLDAEHARIRFS